MFGQKTKLITELQKRIDVLQKEVHRLEMSCDFQLPYVEFTVNKTFNNDPQCNEDREACEKHVAIALNDLADKNMEFLSERCYELYKQEGGKW